MRVVTALCRGLIVISLCSTSFAADAPAAVPTFEHDIRPILRAHCLDCHGAHQEKEANLDLRLVRFQLTGGDSGPAVLPGQPDASLLLQRVRSKEMPPGEAKLSRAEVELLERWVAAGAPTARPEPEQISPGIGITPEERDWWAFRPITRPRPTTAGDHQVRTPIDALLKQAMPEGLRFSDEADRLTLLKRATLDLTGLPPTAEQIQRFVTADRPDAYEQLIDELLASPHYGERWARHWLDIAGYADSEGVTSADTVRPWAYRYRDYVIRSFNSDKPLDQFLAEQLAGDELAGPINGDLTAEQIELLTATGYLRMAADGTASEDNPETRNQVIADTIKIVSTSLLGLSVACAQCHDHRYDPIPQADYYSLRSVFEPAFDWQNWRNPNQRAVSLYTAADHQRYAEIEVEAAVVVNERNVKEAEFMAAALETELLKYEEALREPLRTAYKTPEAERNDEQKQLLARHPAVNISPGVLYQYNQAAADELKKFDDQITAIRAKRPVHEYLQALSEPAGHAPQARIFHRGDPQQPLEEVVPAALQVLGSDGAQQTFTADSEALPTTGRRLAFAQWLTGGDNPITARVLANRIWLHHFGRGLAGTPADFGRLGTPPTHPELLDWLADELRSSGWQVKKLQRIIMLSTVYRQSSVRDPQMDSIDRENRYYWRRDVQRIDAETLTDRVLATTEKLDDTLYGPAIGVREDETGQVLVDDQRRRSLYLQQRRSQPVALLQAFDAPVMQTNCESRPSSTVATQSLMLMNGEFMLDQADRLAFFSSITGSPYWPAELPADLPALPQSLPPLWQFGYGAFDEASQRTASFTALPHWTGGEWQGSAERPDPQVGWVGLNAAGGHPGDNPAYCAIRRWTSPTTGTLTITGTLGHGSEHGDGVRGRIVVSRSGLAGEWVAQNATAPTVAETIAVEAGDTVDLIVDCREHVSSDSFTWPVQLVLARDGAEVAKWASPDGFHGPLQAFKPLHAGNIVRAWQRAYLRSPTEAELRAGMAFVNAQVESMRLDVMSLPHGRTPEYQALVNLCQALLVSNEFLYVE